MSDYLKQLFSLEGRVAIVNGASTELGMAVVRGLAQSGAVVCGVDDRARDFKELKAKKASVDYSDRQPIKFQIFCDRLYEKYGKFNLLVNIEEVHTPSASSESTDFLASRADTFRQGIEMQIDRINQASKIAAQRIKQSGGGSIVNIISIKNPIGLPDDFSYISTKNALLMITKELAIDLIKDNVKVNNLVIGYVANTEEQETTAHLGDLFWQDLIATTIYFAAQNSSSMTGQDLFLVGSKKLTKQI